MITVIVVEETDIKNHNFGILVISHGIDEQGHIVIMETVSVDDAEYVKYDLENGYHIPSLNNLV